MQWRGGQAPYLLPGGEEGGGSLYLDRGKSLKSVAGEKNKHTRPEKENKHLFLDTAKKNCAISPPSQDNSEGMEKDVATDNERETTGSAGQRKKCRRE